jgi:hypothetical protein
MEERTGCLPLLLALLLGLGAFFVVAPAGTSGDPIPAPVIEASPRP